MVISIENAEHYVWGQACNGWLLVKHQERSVIQERVPAGGGEEIHYRRTARQFFYILEGEATMAFEEGVVVLQKGDGIEIAPHIKYQFRNKSNSDVHFIAISVPSRCGGRLNL